MHELMIWLVNTIGSLGYPGIFKGAIESRATRMTREMYIAAAEAIVRQTPEGELVPDPLDPLLHDRVAKSVAAAAVPPVASRSSTIKVRSPGRIACL